VEWLPLRGGQFSQRGKSLRGEFSQNRILRGGMHKEEGNSLTGEFTKRRILSEENSPRREFSKKGIL
jgi:hypothetical protein